MTISSFVGTRWYKCDLHLHTPASKCFKDQSVTAEQWVQACLDQQLGCVAVTDHNTGEWIDQIKAAAEGTGLTVFPGVEITCSDAKVHLLILFDVDQGSTEVGDFLIKAGVDRSMFGEQTAHADKSIMEIARLAEESGAICIPAHIDEYNGICEAGNQPRGDFLRGAPVTAVQVVHDQFRKPEKEYNKPDFKSELASYLQDYYGKEIQSDRIKTWRQAVVQAQQAGKAILTFSDNPHEKGESRHGLWGIGSRYTWIKMDASPNLESLRQALLVPKHRIRHDFECPAPGLPYQMPDTWLERIIITGTKISGTDPLEVQFSPQMTTIVGGRGSGKSSVLRFIRGIFPHLVNALDGLPQVKRDFDSFFSIRKKDKGVLADGTKIELYLRRQSDQYYLLLAVANGKWTSLVHKFNELSGTFEPIEDALAAERFELDIFAQRQIFDIGDKTNTLRERIDQSSAEVSDILTQLKELKSQYLKQGAIVRDLEIRIEGKADVISRIRDAQARLDAFAKSGVSASMEQSQRFRKEDTLLNTYQQEIQALQTRLQEAHDGFQLPELVVDEIDASHQPEIKPLRDQAHRALVQVQAELKGLVERLAKTKEHFVQGIADSKWQQEKWATDEALAQTKTQLEAQGTPVDAIQTENNKKAKLEAELAEIQKLEPTLQAERQQQEDIRQRYLQQRQQLTEERKKHLTGAFQGANVKVKVAPCRDLAHFEAEFREIASMGGDTYEEDITALKEIISRGNPSQVNQRMVDSLLKAKRNADGSNTFGQRFVNKLKSFSGDQWDRLRLIHPEDDIVVEYKSNQAAGFKPLSTASPGQKTAAILTLILSQGAIPLILDQPEDDLDNSLIYQLVVEELRRSKEKRQIIVVTHNANIPVNGDSEHIVVMDSESKLVKPKVVGSLEEDEIKRAICDVMEGGTEAFDMRYQRYSGLYNDLLT